ncbi:MAG: hypothetical protein U9N01_04355 [Euryarchaeota archaeon]|nr:hypothetical protein [Euryarchaeota archaeon]
MIADAVEEFVKEYRDADKDKRRGIRNIALINFFRWEIIKDALVKIDKEAAP